MKPYRLHDGSVEREASNKLSAILDSVVIEEASKKAGNLLLNSSSSSSSSSLASSLSFSTSSSTSTVLAALESLRPGRDKKGGKVTATSSSEDDEEAGQAIPSSASSSSSSSSSGLSSMSSSYHRSDQTSAHEEPSREVHAEDADSEQEVKECLSELVRSVVDGEPLAPILGNQSTRSYYLHKAVPAQTNSKSSTSGSSEDEETNLLLSRKVKTNREQVKPIAQLSSTCTIELTKSQQLALLHYGDQSAVLRLARRSISASPTDQPSLAAISAEEPASLVWWPAKQAIDPKLKGGFGELAIGRIVRCLLDRNLIVWILADRREDRAPCEALETTLDDIALALDEPVDVGGKPANVNKAIGYSALVWLCPSERTAQTFKKSFESFVSENDCLNSWHLMDDRVSRLPASVSAIDQLVAKARGATGAHRIAPDYCSSIERDQRGKQVQVVSQSADYYTKSSELAPVTCLTNVTEPKRQLTQQQQSDGKVVNHGATGKDCSMLSRSTSVPTLSAQIEGARPGCEPEIDRVSSDKVKPGAMEALEASSVELELELDSPSREVRGSTTNELIGQNKNERQAVESPSAGGSGASKTNVVVRKEKEKDKRALKKSASGLDLSQQNLSSSSGLSSYYRNVASKVISNGQSRIKSFKDEMIKLNNRIPLSGSTSSAGRRLSMLILQNGKQNQDVVCDELATPSTAHTKDQERAEKSKRRGESSKRDNNELVGQQSSSSGRLNDSKACSSRDRNAKSNESTPAVRPRTSILKSKVNIDGGACDINNNQIEDAPRAISSCDYIDDQSRSALRSAEIKANSAQATKPKSILKTSKSVSNVSLTKELQVVGVEESPSNGRSHLGDGGNKRRHNSNIATRDNNAKRIDATSHNNNLLEDDCDYQDAHHHVVALRQNVKTARDGMRRRSTYSVAQLNLDELEDENEKEDTPSQLGGQHDFESSESRERAFERLRSRASCYDITRLMSKNGLQNQLNKLRSGSNSSVSGKLRQRRPALLINETACEKSENNEQLYGDQSQPTRRQASETGESSSSSANLRLAVRADDSNKLMKTKTDHHDGRQSPRESSRDYQPISTDIKANEPATQREVGGLKRSEFDPRSLRRLPSSGAHETAKRQTLHRAESLSRQAKVVSDSARSEGERHKSSQVSSTQHESPQSSKLARKESADIGSASSSESSSEAEDVDEPCKAESKKARNSSLTKTGPFSLLRQSFNQKTLSSMLRFPNRASMRISPAASGQSSNSSASEGSAGTDRKSATNDKSAALAIAEANLLAAKQLKQQAQRLKEQQKREQQQQSIETTELMMAAVQYNQQVQRHQQQQQQLFYQQQQQQQFAMAARGHLFDPTPIRIQQQMLQQFQRQQQLAYMSNLNSTQYMQQLTTAVMGPATGGSMVASVGGQHMLYMQAPLSGQPSMQPAGGYQRKSMLKSGSRVGAQLYPNQQMIPMSVNHHSSLNIVYSGGSGASQIPQLQHGYERRDQEHHLGNQVHSQSQPELSKSSLGASMRKTVKSMLINRSSFLSSSNTNNRTSANHDEPTKATDSVKLKSALKSGSRRDLVLNSEGSDGDGSSSDSTTTNTLAFGRASGTLNSYATTQVQPKSALKKGSRQSTSHRQSIDMSATSSSKLTSGNKSTTVHIQGKNHGQAIESGSRQRYTSATLSRSAATRQTMAQVPSGRKNVTFCSKLTSIQ